MQEALGQLVGAACTSCIAAVPQGVQGDVLLSDARAAPRRCAEVFGESAFEAIAADLRAALGRE
jgi:hypothetical protein